MGSFGILLVFIFSLVLYGGTSSTVYWAGGFGLALCAEYI